MKKLKELLMKKMEEGKLLSDDKKQAKCDMLDELEQITNGAIKGKLEGLKKVTVVSPTEEGLEKGLKVAKEKVSEMSEESEEKEEDENKSDKLSKLKKKIAEMKG